jgi:hypothetical protein
MFDFPLTIPKQTTYRKLGLTPEASADDIREAKGRLQAEVNAKLVVVEKALNKVYKDVPGLREALDQEQALEKRGEASDAEALSEIRQRLSELVPLALEIAPQFRRLVKEQKDLDQQSRKINLISLDSPEKRRDYDSRHPPLGLLRFADATQDSFLESRTALFLLRRELSAYFSQKGETVFHPSDLTRQDFRQDFAFNKELDD